MSLFNCRTVCTLANAQNELGLLSIHCGVESARVHTKGIDELSLADVTIHSNCALEGETHCDQSKANIHLVLPQFYYNYVQCRTIQLRTLK